MANDVSTVEEEPQERPWKKKNREIGRVIKTSGVWMRTYSSRLAVSFPSIPTSRQVCSCGSAYPFQLDLGDLVHALDRRVDAVQNLDQIRIVDLNLGGRREFRGHFLFLKSRCW